jgi:hypothetical protein
MARPALGLIGAACVATLAAMHIWETEILALISQVVN